MPLGIMDKESVTLLHISTLISGKNNDILNCAGKWMEIENTILSEITQTQKYKCGVYSFISEFEPKTMDIEPIVPDPRKAKY